ncbi:MAG TPA: NAD(P)-binding domain-containing protein [Burkholderiaceae bacterium]|nr:NAD(P)-binding domain-containing protein [Burkholderiaceae bacterium]
MKVAILGTGSVGQALARGFVALGHQTTFGSRDPAGETAKKAIAAAPGSNAATFAAAAKDADIAVLATPWSGTQNALALANAANLAGKVLIDVTNPLDFAGGKPRLALGFSTSAGEQIQAWAPQAKVVKAFNTVGNGMMFKPKLRSAPTMFIAGNDADAKQTVAGLLKQFGWESSDLGGIEAARLLEPFAMVWITHAFKKNAWMYALTPVDA